MASSSSSRKRNHTEMSLEKKIDLIKASAAVPKPSQKDLGEKFGIGRSTVSDILKKKAHYLEAWESNTSAAKRQRIKKATPMDSLNNLLFSFFCDKHVYVTCMRFILCLYVELMILSIIYDCNCVCLMKHLIFIGE